MKTAYWRKEVGVLGMIFGLLAGVGFATELPGVAPPLVDEVTDEVRWQAWAVETFKRAREENKPVLASVEARWQYESQYLRVVAYRDREIAGAVNREFIPVRVDADQRPDIVRRYAPGGLPAVALLNPDGLPLKDPKSGERYAGVVLDGESLREVYQAVLERDREAGIDRLPAVEAGAEALRAARADVFSDDFVRIILRNISNRYDAEFGGYGDAAQRYSGKRAEANTLELLLLASQLWNDQTLLVPLTHTLRRMAGGTFYQRGFGEGAATRDWNRLRNESTLKTNMALMPVYLGAYRATGENYFMEIVYKTMDDTLDFQDVFLRKGFGGAFYAARRAMLPSDFDRGLSQGPLVQSIITPWSCEAVRSYLLMGEATRDLRWQKQALQALDFLLTEMVRADGRVAYSLDRDAPGVDTIFAAHPALAGALLEAFQRTGERRYLEQAERVMVAAEEVYWQQAGYYGDVAVATASIGLLSQPGVDLDANAEAVEVLLALEAFTGKGEYRERAKQILATLAGEAQVGTHDSAAFAVAALKYVHPPVKAVVVGGRKRPETLALRDSALALSDLHLLVEVVDPEMEPERLQQMGHTAGENPEVFLSIGLVTAPPVRDPAELADALEKLEERAQR